MLHDLKALLLAQSDYLVYLLVGLALFAGVELTLRRRRGGALRWPIWAGVGLLLGLAWWPANRVADEAQRGIALKMGDLAAVFADLMEQTGHSRITLATPPDDPGYLRLIEAQIRLLKKSPTVSDVYTMRTGPDGKVVIIVDAETDYDRNGRFEGAREQRTAIGHVYDHVDKGLELALAGTANFDRETYSDDWGDWVSAWVPLRRPDGSLDGVLGVDFPAAEWLQVGRQARRTLFTQCVGLIGLLLAGGAALALLRRKVAELERLQAHVRENDEHIRQVVDTALDAAITMDAKGLISAWNRQAEAIFGWPAAEVLGRTLGDVIVPPAMRDAHTRGMNRYLATGTSTIMGQRLELTAMCRDGREIPVELSVNPIMVGGVRQFSSFLRDISARRKAQTDLERLATHLGDAQRIGNIGSWSIDLASDALECSDQAFVIFGRSRSELEPTRKAFRATLHPADHERYVKTLVDAVAQIQAYDIEARIVRPDGTIRWVEIRGQPAKGADGTAASISGTIRDITERKESEASLVRSHRQFEEVFENAQAGLVVMNPYGRIVLANRRAAGLLEGPGAPLVGLRLQDVLLDRALLADAADFPPLDFERTAAPQVPLHCKRDDGSVFFGEMVLRAFDGDGDGGVLAQINDTTARELHLRLELRSQRMESIGTLSGGVAHDLNNSLAPILMGIELLRARNPESSNIINTIERCAQRGAAMVKQLLTFARGSEGQRRTLIPTKLLEEMAGIARGTFPKNITVTTDFVPDPWPVSADATQLHQVLLNLCVNARDAMPQGGTLSLTTRNSKIDATFAGNFVDAKAGRYLEWLVADTGEGMPPEVVERIFDPFFTTKGPDKGTGLGLSTVLGIVRSHGGFLHVESVPRKGSCFHVYLPAVAASTETNQPFAADSSLLLGDGETILVVDDEPSVREITAEVLRLRNFRVILASDGSDALMKVADNPGVVRVVMTDLHMPHLDGHQLVKALQRMLPTAGVIVASGTLTPKDVSEFKACGVVAVIEKPFVQAELFRALRTALRFVPSP
jgi:PAS domain S-box-containing protein